MLPEPDAVLLRHMLDAARTAQGFVAERTRSDLHVDEMLAFAVLHALQIIGEAASKVSPEGRAVCPGMPWPLIVGMRHRLVHGYADVDLDRVWNAVANDVPALITELERVLGATGPSAPL